MAVRVELGVRYVAPVNRDFRGAIIDQLPDLRPDLLGHLGQQGIDVLPNISDADGVRWVVPLKKPDVPDRETIPLGAPLSKPPQNPGTIL